MVGGVRSNPLLLSIRNSPWTLMEVEALLQILTECFVEDPVRRLGNRDWYKMHDK